MIHKLLLVLIALTALNIAQTKYFIYLKDKGIEEGKILLKNSAEYLNAEKSLSTLSRERRYTNRIDIDFNDVPIKAEYLQLLESAGVKVIRKLKWFNAVSVYLTQQQLSTVSSFPFVDKIERVKKLIRSDEEKENILLKESFSPSNIKDDYGPSQTQLSLSEIIAVHKKGINGKNVLIGVLDTGFDWERHVSLQSRNVIAEYDFVFNDTITANEAADVSNQHSHGTFVFSILAGSDPGNLIGVTPEAAFVLAKTEDVRSEKHIEEDNYAAALEWMDSIGVDITTSSLGYNQFDSPENSYTYNDLNGNTTIVTKAANIAFDKGITLFTAAGNEGDKAWFYIIAPADGKNVIAVGAVNYKNELADFSSRGPTSDGRIKPDILAMGVSVVGAVASTNNGYTTSNGTSAATPIGAGIGALLKSAFPHLTNKQIRNILITNSDNLIAPNNQRGYGLTKAKNVIEFPNTSKVGTQNFLNKIFLNDSLQINSPKIFISGNGKDFDSINLSTIDSLVYTHALSGYSTNQNIQFYFTYKVGAAADEIREPAVGKSYFMKVGEDEVTLRSDVIPEDFALLQNYPNPFNNTTNIIFKAPRVENVELIIINSIGEKVATAFKGATAVGENVIAWDGKNSSGIPCASGVYFYMLKFGDKVLGKHMVLIK